TKVNVETAADGSGTIVPAQNVASASSITVYSITRDAADNFVANVAAGAWALTSKTGGVVNGDLVAAGDAKSAVFTGAVIGTAKIEATSGALTKNSSGTITVVPGGVSYFTVTGIKDPQTSGTLSSPKITAYDAAGNIKTNYTGTITFTSTDPQATLPPPYTFVAGDNGTATFTSGVKLVSTGQQTVTVTDPTGATGSQTVTVQQVNDNENPQYNIPPAAEDEVAPDPLVVPVLLEDSADGELPVNTDPTDYGFGDPDQYKGGEIGPFDVDHYIVPQTYTTKVKVLDGKGDVVPYTSKGLKPNEKVDLKEGEEYTDQKHIEGKVDIVSTGKKAKGPSLFDIVSGALGREVEPDICLITKIEGKAMVRRASTGEWVEAEEGMLLEEGDVIYTTEGSSVSVNIKGEKLVSDIIIDPDSQLMFLKIAGGKGKGSGQTMLDFAKGKITVNTSKMQGSGKRFEIKTPTSIVNVQQSALEIEVTGLES
ncbi:MAG: hypothetical protein HQ594_00230, partial [Candidatus Omnitrophica bacterium]|nr:hypothetical protein [Candidatus Omnitrophota bacterium]